MPKKESVQVDDDRKLSKNEVLNIFGSFVGKLNKCFRQKRNR